MLTRLFVTRPTLTVVVVLLALIGGTLAALGLREQELPNLNLPAATIVVFYSAAIRCPGPRATRSSAS